MKKKKKKKRSNLPLVILLIVLVTAVIGLGAYLLFFANEKTEVKYLANDIPAVIVYDKDKNEIEMTRGTLVNVSLKSKKIDDIEYRVFKIDDEKYYVLDEYLEDDRYDCVREKSLYTLRNTVVTKDYDSYLIADYYLKNREVEVTGYHELRQDGTVDYYEVDHLGYISADKLDYSYHYDGYDSSIYASYDFYGGDPTLIDYYPKEEVSFAGNVMPERVAALYINAESVEDVDEYIAIADSCGINAFVVDIKDSYVDTQLAYDSPVAREYAPSTSNIPNTYEDYKNAIQKLKDHGYYVIGRITAFKDDAFARDN